MKYTHSISLFIFITCTASGMHLQYYLPHQATITKRLWDAGFSNFAKETKIGAQLGEKLLGPIMLYGTISDILQQYLKNYPFIIAAWDHTSIEPFPPLCPNKSQIMHILLQDYPRAIEALENNQWIEPKTKITDLPSWGKTLNSFAPCINK